MHCLKGLHFRQDTYFIYFYFIYVLLLMLAVPLTIVNISFLRGEDEAALAGQEGPVGMIDALWTLCRSAILTHLSILSNFTANFGCTAAKDSNKFQKRA